jgi:hypothetical protein
VTPDVCAEVSNSYQNICLISPEFYIVRTSDEFLPNILIEFIKRKVKRNYLFKI